MSKEKYIGEALLKDKPKKKLSLIIKDGSVVTSKIADKNVTSDKLSDDVLVAGNIKYGEDGNVSDTLDKLNSEKFDKSNVVQDFGDEEDKVISQKTVSEKFDDIIKLINVTGFTLDLVSENGWNFSSSSISRTDNEGNYIPFTTLSVKGYWYGEEITDKMFNVKWTRKTDYPESDEIWNKTHENSVNDIHISFLDIGAQNYRIGSVVFKCEAEFTSDADKYHMSRSINL